MVQDKVKVFQVANGIVYSGPNRLLDNAAIDWFLGRFTDGIKIALFYLLYVIN